MKRREGKIVLRGKKPAGFWFHLAGRNGQIIVTSEMYSRKAGAINGIHALLGVAADVAKAETLFEDRTK